ncbi:hypothetical protein KM043_015853 [Ampulex compressa]|uniref:Venom protein n=1 Tax=Ampulex compressa TaxID=860918 RepID=A0A1W6EVZ4_AMPCP|nr:venom protein [Ampulex compressa]KAG7202171.1 hypothetical protein KM043_015853 [Ampulex compressa]
MYQKTLTFALFLCFIVVEIVGQQNSGFCPLANKVSVCVPRCVSDRQCSGNEKCCPNKCGGMSCASPSAVYTGNDGGYRGSQRDKEVYCNGIKCPPYQKCQFDRSTKREKCVRT